MLFQVWREAQLGTQVRRRKVMDQVPSSSAFSRILVKQFLSTSKRQCVGSVCGPTRDRNRYGEHEINGIGPNQKAPTGGRHPTVGESKLPPRA